MASDGVVQIPPESSGKKIDTSELSRGDGTVVERQRVVLGDATNVTSLGSISPAGEMAVTMRLDNIEAQLKRIARLLEIQGDIQVSVDDAG